MGVLSGYLNTDAEIMQNQREYDAETKRKKEEAIALAASDQKKWEKSLIKDAINNNNTFYTTMLKEKAKGKASIKGGFHQAVLEDNERIKLGLPSKGFSKFINTVNDVGEYSTIFTDKAGNKVRFKADIVKGDINNYRSFMTEINGNYRAAKRTVGPDGKAGNYFASMSDENLGRIYSTYMTSLTYLRSAEKKGQVEGFLGTNFLPDNEFDNGLPTPFYGGTALANELIKRGLNKKTNR